MMWVTSAKGCRKALPHISYISAAFILENHVAFKYSRHLSKRRATPQTEPIPGREAEMSPDSAGGFAFDISDWHRLRRFLILGSEGGTYYVGEHALTVENAEVVARCVSDDGVGVVNEIVAVSESGAAPKNDASILALAIAAKRGDDETRKFALTQLPRVCRTGTHLFEFAEFIAAPRRLGTWNSEGGWELVLG